MTRHILQYLTENKIRYGKKLSQNSKTLNIIQNYIFKLSKILQCKTGHEFKKSHLFEPSGEFLTFP